jgi:threonine aldolase
MSRVVDLRSDLLAPASDAMIAGVLAALREAPAFGLREDARQRATEARIADLLGCENALLFPTCTMANQTALALHMRPGEAVLTQADAHILTSEAGGAAAIAGVQIISASGDVARPDAGLWRAAIEESRGAQQQRISLLALENTHNRAGGRVLSKSAAAPILALAQEFGLRAHLDGARLIHAAVALGVAPRALTAGFDSVSLSLNKGLGAPFGAALAGSRGFIDMALHMRQRLGGGMRRMGVFAAAAEAGLQDFADIAEDHRRARDLAKGLAGIPGLRPVAAEIETNIALFEVEPPLGTAASLCEALAAQGVLALALTAARLRLTTHRGVSDADIACAIAAFSRVAAGVQRNSGAASGV